ncbi:MAG: hypothetical protein LBS97_07150 [Treponema sp.]|jgi:hypothetical protein|nr:hypothetical protein [Treponema sp.]
MEQTPLDIVIALIPHGNVLGEIAAEQQEIFKIAAQSGVRLYRTLPFCCFLSGPEKPPEVWKKEITGCRILPPVVTGNAVEYPVIISPEQGTFMQSGIITAFSPDSPSWELPEVPGGFQEQTLRVFRLCSIRFGRPAVSGRGGLSHAWTIGKTLWVKL